MEEKIYSTDENNKKEEKEIPTWAGLIIALVLIVAFVLFFWKFQKVDAPTEAPDSQTAIVNPYTKPIPSENPSSVVPVTKNSANGEMADSGLSSSSQNASETVDINYEIQKMDDSANSVNENDFNSADMSDAQAGL